MDDRPLFTDRLVLNHYEATHPDAPPALRTLERLYDEYGVANDHVVLPPGVHRPRAPRRYLVFPKALMERFDFHEAIQKVLPPGWIYRSDHETPAVSEEWSRQRGFSDLEIEVALRPWVQQARDAALRQLREAERMTIEAQQTYETTMRADPGQVTVQEESK